MLLRIKNLFSYGGVEKSAYYAVKNLIMDSNRSIVKRFSLLAYVLTGILFFLSLIIKSLSLYTYLYGGAFVLTLAVWLIAIFPGKNSKDILLADMYLFSAVLFAIGIVLGTVFSPREISATYIALLLAVPQLFTDRPYRMYILIVVSVAVFIFSVIACKDKITWNSDIVNSVLFGFISIVLCTYSINNRITRYCLQEKIRFLAENDQLTGLRNRYCYHDALQRASMLESESIYCVYVDVNGLHELNNTKGHEAGDKMLQYVASVMQHLFGEDNTYRIGGDEFVAIGMDKELPFIEELVAQMKSAVESAGYHVAAGISYREKKGIEINSIVTEAETEMYADKAAFYQDSNHDRRR